MNWASLLWTSFTRDDGVWDLFLQKPAQEKIFYLGGAPLDDAYDIRFALFRKADGRIKEVSDASFWYRCSGDSVLSCSG